MTLKIIWSEFAETQIDEIYEYYQRKVSPRVAKKLVRGIINEPKKLIKVALIWQEEELLKIIKYYRLVIDNQIVNMFFSEP